MRRSTSLLVLLSCAACGTEGPPTPTPAPDWDGPPVHAAVVEGGVDVVVTAPTLGWRFEHTGVEVKDGVADAEFLLTQPAADAVVGQSVTELHASAPAAKLPATVRTVRVMIVPVQDGAQYLRKPDSKLAITVPMPR